MPGLPVETILIPSDENDTLKIDDQSTNELHRNRSDIYREEVEEAGQYRYFRILAVLNTERDFEIAKSIEGRRVKAVRKAVKGFVHKIYVPASE